MKLMAALRFVIELLTQLTSLGEEGLARIVRCMDYIRELTNRDRDRLPTIQEFTEFLDKFTSCHYVDCDADPVIPSGLVVNQHIKGNKVRLECRKDTLYVDNQKVILHLVKRQVGRGTIRGHELYQELENGKLVLLNANILDYLLAHPELIPNTWKGKRIYFWGTIYRGSDGHLCVRYLYWFGSEWDWNYDWLGSDWDSGCPAAVLAS